MVGLWKFASKGGKGRGLLALFTLHSLNQKPKSGYELLKEIREKTKDAWAPSKGTLYPILKQLEAEKLTRVCKTGKRSKNIFELTHSGKKTLRGILEGKKDSREKYRQFKNLLIEIFGEEKITLKELIFEIKYAASDASVPGNKERVVGILEKCLADLRRLG